MSLWRPLFWVWKNVADHICTTVTHTLWLTILFVIDNLHLIFCNTFAKPTWWTMVIHWFWSTFLMPPWLLRWSPEANCVFNIRKVPLMLVCPYHLSPPFTMENDLGAYHNLLLQNKFYVASPVFTKNIWWQYEKNGHVLVNNTTHSDLVATIVACILDHHLCCDPNGNFNWVDQLAPSLPLTMTKLLRTWNTCNNKWPFPMIIKTLSFWTVVTKICISCKKYSSNE